jgi:hypothetical protein
MVGHHDTGAGQRTIQHVGAGRTPDLKTVGNKRNDRQKGTEIRNRQKEQAKGTGKRNRNNIDMSTVHGQTLGRPYG